MYAGIGAVGAGDYTLAGGERMNNFSSSNYGYSASD
jgi:hypothetical protein